MEPAIVKENGAITRNEAIKRWNEIEPMLRRYANKKNGQSNTVDVDELLRDTFAVVLEKLHTFREDKNFPGWSYRIMFNLFIDEFNRKKKMLAGEDGEVEMLKAVEESPDQERVFLGQQAKEMLDELPEEQKIVLTMKFLEDMDFDEISKVLKIPEGTAKSRYDRGLKSLRKLME